MLITKATGEKEQFSEEKLRNSIKRAGVPEILHDAAVARVKGILREDIPTSEIYSHILELLGTSRDSHFAARYSHKKAIMDLGPTGFPFEKFVAAILRSHGYKVATDVMVNGLCVAHEVDVVAEKDTSKIMVECKFHNNIGNRTDVKVALYIMARYQDLVAGNLDRDSVIKFNEAWLVTNTKCSQEAIAYATCMGMKIISWGCPQSGNLQDLIERNSLHPITCLNTITSAQKQFLLDNNVILAQDLRRNPMFVELLHLSPDKAALLHNEVENLKVKLSHST